MTTMSTETQPLYQVTKSGPDAWLYKGGIRRTLAKASQLLLLFNHCIFIVYLCDLHQSRANDLNFNILSLYLVMMGYLFHKMQINQCYTCESSVCCVTVGQWLARLP